MSKISLFFFFHHFRQGGSRSFSGPVPPGARQSPPASPKREVAGLKAGTVITVAQFKQRVAQILNSYAVVKAGKKHSRLGKLVRGMPDRFTKCKKNKCGLLNNQPTNQPHLFQRRESKAGVGSGLFKLFVQA